MACFSSIPGSSFKLRECSSPPHPEADHVHLE